jgi:hypothetical protein
MLMGNLVAEEQAAFIWFAIHTALTVALTKRPEQSTSFAIKTLPSAIASVKGDFRVRHRQRSGRIG